MSVKFKTDQIRLFRGVYKFPQCLQHDHSLTSSVALFPAGLSSDTPCHLIKSPSIVRLTLTSTHSPLEVWAVVQKGGQQEDGGREARSHIFAAFTPGSYIMNEQSCSCYIQQKVGHISSLYAAKSHESPPNPSFICTFDI